MMTREPLRMRTKLAFGVGSVAEAGAYIAFNSFNFLYYNHVLGLPGTLCGLAVTIALVVDAVCDPVIGFISDRHRGRLGRRHPFLYAAPIPVAIAFYCIYSPPTGLGDIPLFLWLTGFTLLLRQALSLYHVPHLALGAELSPDYLERSVVMSYNAIFAVLGGASAAFFGWTWLGRNGGADSPDGYTGLSIVVALVASALIFVSAHFTRDQIPRLPQAPPDLPRATLRDFLSDSFACLRNPNYASLLLGLLFLSLMIGTRETLNAYLNLFYWQLPEDRIRLFSLASPPAYVVAFLATVHLHRAFDKRATIIGAALLMATTAALPISLRLVGAFPANGTSALLAALLAAQFTFYLGFATLNISVMSGLADIADEHELSSGRRQEGMFYAARTFFSQLSSGLGHLVAGLTVDWIDWPEGAKPGMVAEDVLLKLGLVDGPIAALPALVAVFFYGRFRIDRTRHAHIQLALASNPGRIRR